MGVVLSWSAVQAASPLVPTQADVSYGPFPHQLMDVYVPKGAGPFSVLVWYGGIWKPSKHPPDLNAFFPHDCAVIAVQTRTMEDAQADKADVPIAYVLSDARRALRFAHLHAKEWNLDPHRMATGGGSQATIPSFFAGCTAGTPDLNSSDPVDRESAKVVAIGFWRGPGSIDPKRLQEWNPGVEWGAPAWGCSVAESVKRYEELQPVIAQWSPENFVTKDTAPIYIQNDFGMTRPEGITEPNYRTHSPLWGVGLKKFAEARGVTCYQKYPGLESTKYKDMWDFLIQRLAK